MDAGYKWLKSIADRMNREVAKGAAPRPERLTVRQLLEKFGSQRRSDRINNHIRNGLEQFKLRTNQDVTVAWIDSSITIELDSDAERASESPRTSDPTHRVSGLAAANHKPASVKPESPLQEATTIMQMNGYARLPVMKNERDVAGIVTWQSIGTRLVLRRECTHVRQCMEPAEVIPETTPLFDAIRVVSQHGYVLVRGPDRTITGMVTEADLSHQLGQFAGPFLFVGEIEGHLRNLVHGNFTLEELQAASAGDKPIEGSSDLTFGGFCRLLENTGNWERLNLGVDRVEFIKHLNSVREMRNDLMHFNPDGIGDEHRETLRNVARFFDQLARAIAL